MTWSRLQGGANRDCSVRWLKFVDVEAARGHVSDMAAILAMPDITTLPFSGRVERTQQLFEALRGFYLAIDMDPFDAWPYSPERLNCDAGRDDVPGLYYGLGYTQETELPMARTWAPEALRLLRQAGWNPDDVGYPILYGRVDFRRQLMSEMVVDWNRRVQTLTNSGDVPLSAAPVADDMGIDRANFARSMPRNIRGNDGGGVSGSDGGWEDAGFTYAAQRLDANTTIRVFKVVMPLRFSWDLAVRCAGLILAAGGLSTVIDKSVEWGVRRNFALVRAVGGPRATASVLQQLDAHEIAVEQNRGPLTGVGLALDAASKIPVVGMVASGLRVAMAAFTQTMSSAGYADIWGRGEPYLMGASFTGVPDNPGVSGYPSTAVPRPHGFPRVAVAFSFPDGRNLVGPAFVAPRAGGVAVLVHNMPHYGHVFFDGEKTDDALSSWTDETYTTWLVPIADKVDEVRVTDADGLAKVVRVDTANPATLEIDWNTMGGTAAPMPFFALPMTLTTRTTAPATTPPTPTGLSVTTPHDPPPRRVSVWWVVGGAVVLAGGAYLATRRR